MLWRKRLFLITLLIFSASQVTPLPAQAAECASKNLAECLPAAERDIFILDISGSNDVAANWQNSLRPSLIQKLQQPFGFPINKVKGKKPVAPLDVSVSLISSNSASQPLLKVVSEMDARKIWGMISNVSGASPSAERLKVMANDIFGGDGAYTNLSQTLLDTPLKVDSIGTCQKFVVSKLDNGTFMKDLDKEDKFKAANTICEVHTKIVKNIVALDVKLSNPRCENRSACSDVMGALLNMSKAANDMVSTSSGKQSSLKLCLAIASDMMHFSPNMKKDSILNSRYIAENAASTSDAQNKGAQAATLIGITFPTKVVTRVFILGEGTGTKPLPLERMSFLNAYWSGFWSKAGIKSSAQTKSLDSACAS